MRIRIHRFLARLALVAGVWAALAGVSEAQKGKGKGGGGRAPAARSAPARSAPAQRAPVQRSAPAQRSAPRVQTPVQRAPSAQAPRTAPKRAPAVRDLDRNAPNLRDFNAQNRDRNRDWDRNRDGRYGYRDGYYRGGRGWDNDNDDWWRWLAYGTAARFLGVPFGNYWYGASPYYGGYGGYGRYGYGPGLYGGYGSPRYYDRGYADPYYYSEPYSSAAPASNVALMNVIVPDPNARVWVQGRETSSRGTERVYNSPPLEPGYEYTYTVRATWREDGQTMTAERRVSVDPGSRVTVDFTRGPAEAISE